VHNLVLFFCVFFPDLAAQLDVTPTDAERWAVMLARPSATLKLIANFFVRPCLRIDTVFVKIAEASDQFGDVVEESDYEVPHYVSTDSRVMWTLNQRYRLIWSMTERFVRNERITGHSELYLEQLVEGSPELMNSNPEFACA
jgi:hypothetical protein